MEFNRKLIVNIGVAVLVYFALTYFFFANDETLVDMVKGTLVFAVIYGCLQVAFVVFKERRK